MEASGGGRNSVVGPGKRVETAAVLGAGVMGAAIAAHLANAGISCLLLDRKAADLGDAGAGPARGRGSAANHLALSGLDRARRARPASFFTPGAASLVRAGNFEDDLPALGTVDWVIEAIVEDLEAKRSLYRAVAPHLRADAILSSNTSGLSVAELADCLPTSLRPRFLVTHFFNPPRYLHLLELVAGPDTDPEVYSRIVRIGEEVLGKGIVHAKDTPNFIANRIGTYGLLHAVHLMVERGYTIAEVDQLTGKAMGRPRSATFRTADLVGLDTLLHVAQNLADRLPDDPGRALFTPPAFVRGMAERGWLGEKAGAGFWRKVRAEDGSSAIWMLDPARLEHVPAPKVAIPSLELGRNIPDLRERLVSFLSARDRGAEFVWANLSATLVYTAGCLPEVSDDILNVDRALRWGFGWELGPFELWDAIGVARSCERLAKEGREVPPLAEAVLAHDGSFYGRKGATRVCFDFASRTHLPIEESPRVLRLADRKAMEAVPTAGGALAGAPRSGPGGPTADASAGGPPNRSGPGAPALRGSRGIVWQSADATLVDLGDEVACLEFHTKMNTIGPGIIEAIERSLDLVEEGWRGLVLANEAENFSAGANLLLILGAIDDDDFDEVDWMVRRFQAVTQRIRYSSRPVVAAPHGLTLGGGCEVVMAANRVVAGAEAYIGLVELGAGVIPAGGGCKEWVRRIHLAVPESVDADLMPWVRRAFQTIGMAKVSTSGPEARDLGYLAPDDLVVLNPDHRIHEAKRQVLALDLGGFVPGRPLEDIRVVGADGIAVFRAGLHNLRAAGLISEYDQILGDKLAWVLCGGDVAAGARRSEQDLLDLERVAFLELCGDARTLARMGHILKTGKPLRN